jgi:ABC-2 type transport system ATP-binding protein
MIDVQDVSKSYGAAQQVRALKEVSFHVEAGEVIGLLGPNGAGKTTMIKILTGYLQPDSGSVMVDGMDVLTQPLAIQERIGYLPENAPLYPEMSVQAYLRMIADLRRIAPDRQPAYLSTAIRATGLEAHLTRPIAQLSKGFRQRVGLAQAILHRPGLLILDEPTVGLDPTQIVQVRELIRRLARHSTVLLSTHILSEVEATCDRVIILMNGEVKADAAMSALASTAHFSLALDAEGAPAGVIKALRALPGVRQVRESAVPGGREYRVRGDEGLDLRPALYHLAREQDWPLRELRRDVRTLEAVFNDLATESKADLPAAERQDGARREVA